MPHITAGRRFDRSVFRVAGLRRRLALAAGVRAEPFHPAWPPAALVFLRLRQPSLRILGIRRADPVAAAILRSGIDHAGDVSARAEHESLVLAAEQMQRAVRRA